MFLLTIIYLAFIVALIVAQWKIYEKAGRPGWEGIIPIYNLYILITKIIKKEWWWILLCLIPVVNIIAAIFIVHALVKSFGKDVGVTILCFVAGIGYFILAFGDAKYIGPQGEDEADKLLKSLGSNS